MTVMAEDSERRGDLAAPMDAVLSGAALGTVRRWLPGPAGVRLLTHLATRPRTFTKRLAGAATDLGAVLRGSSDVDLERDRRFADAAWRDNPLPRRIAQGYLVAEQLVDHLLGDADLDYRSEQRVRFLADNLVDALAPSNNVLLNPVALRTARDTRGASLATGLSNLLRDVRTAPRVPTMVDRSAFRVGTNLALTPGAVVLRTDMFELIQYRPATPTVRTVPVLLVPPTINKYYVVDLAPGRSLVEHLLSTGNQVFVMSWRNPGHRHAAWDLDAYINAVLSAVEATHDICAVDRTVLMGFCSGGILASLAAALLAVTGRCDHLAGLVLAVTVLDQSRAGFASAALDPRLTKAAIEASRRKGYLDGRALAELFAWLRPRDLVWSSWVSNYLLGKTPPAFDLLYWNSDTTRMPAALHHDFLEMAQANALVTPGAVEINDTPVDLSRVKTDAYVIGGISDHLTPWQSCYRTTQLLGGRTEFVLSTSGHIAAIINPPGNPKATFRTADDTPADPDDWLAAATLRPGTWWSHYTDWLAERCGELKPAPQRLGNDTHRPLVDAPGTYVLQT
jgi:polyhydroxyalkanoate synthase